MPERAEIRVEVERVIGQLSEEGYRVMPSARSWLARELWAGVEGGTIRSVPDARRASAAILAAAAELPDVPDEVTVGHLKRAWQTVLSAGNCPPHRCFFKHVISRSDEDLGEIELFERLLELPE